MRLRCRIHRYELQLMNANVSDSAAGGLSTIYSGEHALSIATCSTLVNCTNCASERTSVEAERARDESARSKCRPLCIRMTFDNTRRL